MLTYIILGGLVILLVFSIRIVEQRTIGVVQRLGKFQRLLNPGLNFVIPIIDSLVERVNLKVRQLDVDIETKTKDNVFVKTTVSVQFYVLEDKVYEAYYKLNNPVKQIKSYVFDNIRARVPKISLDKVFENKDDLALAIKEELTETMSEFGYGIMQTLVTDIDPALKVKESMNEINASERLQKAAEFKAGAAKIEAVKAAEADAESKKLQGEGIANQRKAIIEGLKDSVDDFQKAIKGSNADDVMNLVLITQYLDTMKDIGADSKSNAVFMPHSMEDLAGQIRNGFLQAEKSK